MNKNNEIPFSPGLPILGHLISYQKDRLKLLFKLREKHGNRFRLKIGSKTLTVLTSPEDIRHVMQTNMKNYIKRTNFDQLFGIGLFTTNGETWKKQRKAIQPLFGPRYIESCFPIILDSMQEQLKLYTQRNEAKGDIYDLYARATFDVIIKTIIGIDYSDRFEELNNALNTVSDYLTKANYLPFELPVWLSPEKKRYEESKELIDSIIYKSIEAQKAKEARKDSSMVSLMLQAQEEDPSLEYDNKRIRDNIITLMFAGFETSALTLSWISCLLAQHPKVQNELFEEISAIDLEDARVKGFDAYPFLDAVVNEALRLFPAGWAWTRVAAEADSINGLSIAKNEIIFISPYLTQRDPSLWEKPESFAPERFMQGLPKQAFSFFPFGGGPRICVGKQFGTVEIKLMLASILKEYEFKDGQVPTPSPLATLRSKEGFTVGLRRRS